MQYERCNWVQNTEADEDPLEGLVAGGLQVKEGKFVVGAVLGFMSDGLKQCGGSVELKAKKQESASYQLLHLVIINKGKSY